MYLNINGNRYTVKRRTTKPGRFVRFEGVTPDVVTASGIIEMRRDDGWLMSTDNADSYDRFTMKGGILTFTNEDEPPVKETVESRLSKLEEAIERGLSL